MIDNTGREIRYMRISVTERCNLRCRYCMPEEGIAKKSHGDIMRLEEYVNAVKAAVTLGIDKIRITGGEPLVRKGIISLCEEIGNIDRVRDLAITTNGLLLPECASDLRAAGVRRINISLDTLDKKKYEYITRTGSLSQAMAGFEAAMNAGFEKIKINTVLMRGFNDDEIETLAGMTVKYPVDLRFIELMPVGEVASGHRGEYMSSDEVKKRLPGIINLESSDGVADMYKLPDSIGRIGFISPVSCKFCTRCDKIRLTADGMIKPCLHSSTEISIKGMSLKEMTGTMKRAILQKPDQVDLLDEDNPSEAGRNMNRIGG